MNITDEYDISVGVDKNDIEDDLEDDNNATGISADANFQYNIDNYTNAVPASRLIEDYDRNIIKIPEFQRPYVWNKIDNKTKRHRPSLFIDSILLGLPIPPISIYKEKDAREEGYLIDGRQRIMTMSFFKQGKLQDGSVFKLKGESISNKWKNLSYDELELDMQDKFMRAYIPVTYIRQLDKDMSGNPGASSIYLLFDRLNSGGYALHSHEKRGVLGINNPNLLKLCRGLYSLKGWKHIFPESITNFTKKPNNQTLYNEYIFRALAFTCNYTKYEGNLAYFLDQFMISYELSDSKIDEIINKTNNVINVFIDAKDKIDKYLKPNGKFNVALFDSIFVGCYIALENDSHFGTKIFIEKYKRFVEGKHFEPKGKRSGADKANTINRLNKAIEIFKEV
ncbi:MAG: DUF262 domain-containing protein [Deferribacteraceae bacterium]|jgi:hypothetical protein|nr:DUF262 domain-containing protein [Deferribacteraceae bacterium]